MAGVAGVLASGVYLLTSAPGIGWYDSAEFTAAAATWGIPHAPGYPLYTLITWLGCQGPFDPAAVTNGFSALCGGLAVALAWLLTRKLGGGAAGACFAAGMLAFSPWLWSNATVAEVYAPGLCVVFGVFLLLLEARSSRRELPVFLGAGLAGLGLGLHYMVATCGLGLALLVFFHLPPEPRAGPGQAHLSRKVGTPSWRFGARTAAGAALWAIAGVSINYALLVFRAARDPAVNSLRDVTEANPVLWLMMGGTYRDWWGGEASVALTTKLGMLGTELALQLQLGLALAVLGLAALHRRDRVVAASLLLAILGNIGFFIHYEVHDLENFFLPSLGLLCIIAGVGLTRLQMIVSKAQPERPQLAQLAWLCLLLPLLQLASWQHFDRSGDRGPERYVQALDEHLPEDSVLVRTTLPREWQFDTVFTNWYRQVLGKRMDVRVLTRPAPTEEVRQAAANEIRLHHMLDRPIFVLHPDSAEALGFEYSAVGPLFQLVVPEGSSPPEHPGFSGQRSSSSQATPPTP